MFVVVNWSDEVERKELMGDLLQETEGVARHPVLKFFELRRIAQQAIRSHDRHKRPLAAILDGPSSHPTINFSNL